MVSVGRMATAARYVFWTNGMVEDLQQGWAKARPDREKQGQFTSTPEGVELVAA